MPTADVRRARAADERGLRAVPESVRHPNVGQTNVGPGRVVAHENCACRGCALPYWAKRGLVAHAGSHRGSGSFSTAAAYSGVGVQETGTTGYSSNSVRVGDPAWPLASREGIRESEQRRCCG